MAEEAMRVAKLHRDLVQSRIRRASHRKLGDRPRPLRELLLVHLALVKSHEEVTIRPNSVGLMSKDVSGIEHPPSSSSSPSNASGPRINPSSPPTPRSYRHCRRATMSKGTHTNPSSSAQVHGPRRASWRPSSTPPSLVTVRPHQRSEAKDVNVDLELSHPPDSGYTSPEEDEEEEKEKHDDGVKDEEDEMPLHHLLSKVSTDLCSQETVNSTGEVIPGSDGRLRALQLDLATLCHF